METRKVVPTRRDVTLISGKKLTFLIDVYEIYEMNVCMI